MMLAHLTKVPEFVIEEKEAKALGAAIANVASHYDVGVMSPEMMAWLGLGQTLALVYGPRVMAARIRATRERAARTAEAEANAASNSGLGVPTFAMPNGGASDGVH